MKSKESGDVCEWVKEDEDERGEFWYPSCDSPVYYFNGPLEFYRFKFCPYCGKTIRVSGGG